MMRGSSLAFLIVLVACGSTAESSPDSGAVDGRAPETDSATPPGTDSGFVPGRDSGTMPGVDAGGVPPATDPVSVRLVPAAGVSGMQRVAFGVPLAPGWLADASQIRVAHEGTELAAARTALAAHPDGSLRSVQIQVELAVDGETALELTIGTAAAAGTIDPVPVESLLSPSDGSGGPRVWVQLPASLLAASGVAGPIAADETIAGTELDVWDGVCDYARFDTEDFLSQMSTTGVWLYDRATVNYRGYARSGELAPLSNAYREAAIYAAAISGSGTSTRIGVPGASDDLKYHYAQGLAMHYLLTGDERFRERAEDVADRAHALWGSPGYAGGADFWTERHAGFGLLAYVWAAIVSDDRASEFLGWADEAVDAYLDVMATYPAGYDDPDARCFAHHADAHGEGYGYFGCSPWMSAILADALDAYATERGGDRASAARDAIVKLGRILARDGRDSSGKPYYWMGVGTSSDEVDDYDEHWGESAYVIAMAFHHGGRADDGLRSAALELVAGLAANGSAPHMRSMNWQCRSAVATPYFLPAP